MVEPNWALTAVAVRAKAARQAVFAKRAGRNNHWGMVTGTRISLLS
jgi:hypothetical protein